MIDELRLIVECCGCNFAGAARRQVASVADGLDWGLTHRLTRFHRVQGLVWRALEPKASGIPADMCATLANDAHDQVANNLRMSAEADRLLKAFHKAEIRTLFLKGLALGALVYPDPLLKTGWDIDILVRQDRLADAAELLGLLEYELIDPSEPGHLVRWHRNHKDSLWRHRETGIHVELHPRLVDNPRLLSGVSIDSPTQDVAILPNVTLPTLASDELFAYLCVHGASSAWFRLKWIADLAGLLAGKDADAIDVLYRRSQQFGAARAAGQALLVADDLFGTLGDSELRDQLRGDRETAYLASAALRQIVDNIDATEPTGRTLGTWRIHWTQLLLKPGLTFKVGEACRQLRQAMS